MLVHESVRLLERRKDFQNLRTGSLNLYRLMAAAYCYADETISSPARGVVRFEPLGSTPKRDSRCTFRLRGLAQDCLRESFPEFTRFALGPCGSRGLSQPEKTLRKSAYSAEPSAAAPLTEPRRV